MKGFQNTKIKDIAEEAGIASGTIYNYFRSKDEIMEYIINIEFEKRSKVLAIAIERKSSFSEVIDSFLDYYVEEIRENPSLIKLIMKEVFQSMEYRNIVSSGIFSKNGELMTEIIVRAQEMGEISKIFDAKFIASSILYSLRSFAYVYVCKDNESLDLDKFKKQTKQFYVNGLA